MSTNQDSIYKTLIETQNIYMIPPIVLALKNGNINIITKLFEYAKQFYKEVDLIYYSDVIFFYWLLHIPFYDNMDIINRNTDKDKEILQILIDNKFNVHGNYKGFYHLFSVIRSNNYILLEEFIKLGVQLSQYNKTYVSEMYKTNNYVLNNLNDESPLYNAVKNNNIPLVKILCDIGIDPNLSDKNSLPLIKATEMNLSNIITILINATKDVNIKDINDKTPLINAIINNNIDIINLLIKKRASVDYLNPLYYAVISNNIDIVQLLIKAGASVNQLNGNQENILYQVLNNNNNNINIDIIKLLIDNNIDIDNSDTYGYTPFDKAVNNNNSDVLKLLIEKETDINKLNTNGENLLYRALDNNNINIDIIRLLIDKGIDVNKLSNSNISPLFFAIRNNNNIDVIKLLIDKGVDINNIDNNGFTALTYMISTNNIDVAELLIKKGANINLEDVTQYNYTPLLWSIHRQNIPIIKLLIENGADVNKLNTDGLSPLAKAIKVNNQEIIKLLIENGAK
jgi:hypothetical protein